MSTLIKAREGLVPQKRSVVNPKTGKTVQITFWVKPIKGSVGSAKPENKPTAQQKQAQMESDKIDKELDESISEHEADSESDQIKGYRRKVEFFKRIMNDRSRKTSSRDHAADRMRYYQTEIDGINRKNQGVKFTIDKQARDKEATARGDYEDYKKKEARHIVSTVDKGTKGKFEVELLPVGATLSGDRYQLLRNGRIVEPFKTKELAVEYIDTYINTYLGGGK